MSYTNTFLVEIDGAALPADIVPLLISAYVDDSQQYPDLFELRFRDPGHIVLPKSVGQGRLGGEDLGDDEHGQHPRGADDR